MKLSFLERLLIGLRLDPQGRKRPEVPSSAQYGIFSVAGRVDSVTPYAWEDGGEQRAGTENGLASTGEDVPWYETERPPSHRRPPQADVPLSAPGRTGSSAD